MAAPLTEAAIQQVRQLVVDGELVSGQRLPPEAELAESLGMSRSTVREAVRALVTLRVLDVKRGDGTYVTSLRPELLLAGIGAAADLLQNEFTLELVQVRRILEPAATAMAARQITDAELSDLEACLHQMSVASSHEELVEYDEQFHHIVATAAGNATLASMLTGVSSRTTRGRAWRGVIETSATARTMAQHAEILAALRARDPKLAEAAALMHVSTTEAWFRTVLGAAGR
ncbi:MAG: GntR family transcriptional regulator [Ilumatobacteraceae bacterium]|nr:GntR family transcriptional regulator [Ilumatobacteraceae bacterium]